METLTLEIADSDIAKQALRLRELVETRHVLLGRIEKAEAEKQTVSERIYHRVREEYETRLQTLEKELEPLAAALEKGRASVENKISEIDVEIEELRDALDELSFRHRVGEFDDPTFEESRGSLERQHDRLAQKREELADLLRRFDGLDLPEPSTVRNDIEEARPEADAGADDSVVGPAGTNAELNDDAFDSNETSSRSVVEPCDESPKDHEGAEAFVDPTQWVDEFVDDEADKGASDGGAPAEKASSSPFESTRSDEEVPSGRRDENVSQRLRDEDVPDDRTDGGASDPLTNLADPLDELTEEIGNDAPQDADDRYDAESRPGFPILIIGTGPGAGKRLPLLPMTMTLGREVDNNIEIKDKDVARYHARISYESGRYVVQDLEGSSGTFVNGKQVKRAALSIGDVIRVGGTELRLGVG
jgi:hypothetical protein